MGYYKGGKYWSDKQLWDAAVNGETEEMNVIELLKATQVTWNIGNMFDLAQEVKTTIVMNSLYPVIVVDGVVADGCHRLVYDFLYGYETAKVVKLTEEDLGEPEYDELKAAQENKIEIKENQVLKIKDNCMTISVG